MKIAVICLGCKVNQYEAEGIMKLLEEMGHDVFSDFQVADVYIINTCAVTNEAEKKSRQMVSKCHKLNEEAKIIVCGCASQNNHTQFQSNDKVEYIQGTAYKYKVVNAIEDMHGVNIYDIPKDFGDSVIPKQIRTRAYVKIQDGCNNFCTYCIIPFLRGRNRSRALDDIKKECINLQKYTKEIVLTGIDMSSYGRDINSSLTELIANLADIDIRIRLGSLEPNIIDLDFLYALKKMKSFCPQFHLSLQSGCDRTLKRMNRHYTSKQYLEKVKLIREVFSDASITTDLICGFPEETEEDFNNSINFIEKVKFMQVHNFAYSMRDGTRAAAMQQVPKDIIKERVRKAENVAQKLKSEFLSLYIGRELEVLFETYDVNLDISHGHSRNFIVVYMKGKHENIVKKVTIKDYFADGLIGE